MGKASRKKQKEQREKASRRKFLLGAAALGTLAVGGWFAAREQYNPWKFLDFDFSKAPNVHWSKVHNIAVPVGNKTKETSPEGTISKQKYIQPLELSQAEELKKYAEGLIDYMNQTLELEVVVPLTIVRPSDDFREGYNKRGFIGTRSITVEFNETKSQGRIHWENGGYADLDYDESTKRVDWMIFLGAGLSALTSPVSEALPTITLPLGIENKQRLPIPLMVADETIVEGISHVVSKEYAKSLGVPQVDTRFEELISLMLRDPAYRHVKKSIDWTQKNGPKMALEFYLKDPVAYLREIRAI